ncbi:MAG: IS1634 family transposase [Cellulomonadaceae bacterium]|nr:IS1634 family transposase [Cellulomonadaceae bacterium]
MRTASGATAVQIAEYVGGRRRIVRHVGSGHDDVAVNLLVSQAERLLRDDRQGELDLGLESLARPRGKLPVRSAEPVLFGVEGKAPERVLTRQPVVRKTSSRLLFDVIGKVYDDLGFGIVDDQHFRDLVIARVAEPTSLLDVDRVLAEMGRQTASYRTRKRTLRRCVDGSYRDLLVRAAFTQASTYGDMSLCLYDVTTLYFEAEKEDDLRKMGLSKERRVDPQVVVGLLVDRQGFPLEIGLFEGNKAETLTLLPVIEAFQARHNIEGLVVVGDAGMLSRTNLTALDDAGLGFIVGSRQTTAPLDLVSHFRWHGTYFDDGQIIDTVTPKHRNTTQVNDPMFRAEPVWNPEQYPNQWRAVWAYSRKRFVRDNKTLNHQENRALDVIEGRKPARKPRFVKTSGATSTIDDTLVKRARAVAGLKGYVTNIPASLMPASEVISSYHALWQVEQSFRMSKTDLQARPMFVRTRDSIEAHLTIVFTALAIARTMQQRTGLSIRRILRELRPLRSATIELGGTLHHIPPELTEKTTTLLQTLGHRH